MTDLIAPSRLGYETLDPADQKRYRTSLEEVREILQDDKTDPLEYTQTLFFDEGQIEGDGRVAASEAETLAHRIAGRHARDRTAQLMRSLQRQAARTAQVLRRLERRGTLPETLTVRPVSSNAQGENRPASGGWDATYHAGQRIKDAARRSASFVWDSPILDVVDASGRLLASGSPRQLRSAMSLSRRGLSRSEYRSLVASSTVLPPRSGLGTLVSAAFLAANRVLQSSAWSDEILAAHRAEFSPEEEVREVQRHAVRIFKMACRVKGTLIEGSGGQQTQARLVAEQSEDILYALSESLVRRVVALWAYADRIEMLSREVDALRYIEKSLTLLPELDALVAQLGADEIATTRLNSLTRDAEDVREKVAAMVDVLRGSLVPSTTPEIESPR